LGKAVDCNIGSGLGRPDVIVLDDEDDAAHRQTVISGAQHLSSDYLPQAPPVAVRLPTAAAFPGSPAPVMINSSVVPTEMIFTLQNGNAVLMQRPAALVAGAAYTPTVQLVNVPVHTQVSSSEIS